MANEKKQISAYIPQELYELLEEEAAAEFRSVNSLINVILAERYADSVVIQGSGNLTKVS